MTSWSPGQSCPVGPSRLPGQNGVWAMRAVLQRASRATVRVDGETIGRLPRPGVVALLAATHSDGPEQVATMVRKIAELRILTGEASVVSAGAPVMVISQFTLYGQTHKGRRPSWSQAAPGPVAEPLIDAVTAGLRARGVEVITGRFAAAMEVELVNDGPFTLIIES